MKRKYFYLLIICWFCQVGINPILAQSDRITPASPKAQTFLRYGEIPIGYQTGVPNISIPLYTIKSGDIEIPITLSYHIRNVRPGYDVSEIGLGWTLNIGGQISRTICGAPDETAIDPPINYDFNDIDQSSFEQVNYLDACLKNDYDTEHDVFSIASQLIDGNFIIEKKTKTDFTPYLLTYNNLKIKINTVPYNRSNSKVLIGGINVTDEYGKKYEFGNGMVESTLSLGSKYAFTTWFLKSVTDASGKYTVNYSYLKTPRRERSFSSANSYARILGDYGKQLNTHSTAIDRLAVDVRYSCCSDQQGPNCIDEGMIISEISFTSGKIKFDINVSKDEIYGFKVLDNENNIIRQITFAKSAFSTRSYNNHKRLDAVRISGLNLSTDGVEEYKFLYNPGIMEDMKTGTDFWGYYNQSTDDCTKREYYYTETEYNIQHYFGNKVTLGSNDRQPSLTGSLCETLEKIIYPTKGETEFTYELNSYIDYLSRKFEAGGLRIKKITNKAQNDKTEVKKYSYDNGQIDLDFSAHSNYRTTTFELKTVYPYGAGNGNSYYFYRNRSYNNNLKGELGNNDVWYSTVSETFSNGTKDLGKNIYYFGEALRNKYSFTSSGVDGDEGTMVIRIKKDESYGLLKRKDVYRANDDGSFTIIKEEFHDWRFFPKEHFGNFKLSRLTTFPGSDIMTEWNCRRDISTFLQNSSDMDPYKLFWLYEYDILTGTLRNYGTTTKIYCYIGDSIIPNVVKMSYSYNSPHHNNPTQIFTVSSSGKSQVTNIMYPKDYISSSVNGLISRNIICPISTTSYIDGKLVEGTLIKYNDVGQPTEVYVADNELGTPFVITKDQPYNWGVLKSQFKYLPNNRLGQSFHIGGGEMDNTCYLWSYRSLYPIAEIKNATYQDVISALGGKAAVLNFASRVHPSLDDIKNFLRPILTDTRFMVSYYGYQPMVGLTSKTDPNGITFYYEYDSLGRLRKVKDYQEHIIQQFQYQYKK